MTACDIAAHGCDAAARILDEAAGHQIGAHLGRLQGIGELTIAVVHHDHRLGACLMHCLSQGADGLNGQSSPGGVAPAALDQSKSGPALRAYPDDLRQVRLIVLVGVHLTVADAIFQKRARFMSHNADGSLEGVIGRAEEGDHLVSRPQDPEQGANECVGAADHLDPHQCVLSAEGGGKHLIQDLPAPVIRAIACRSGKIGLRHPMGLEGGKDLLRIFAGDLINSRKGRRNGLVRLSGQLQDPFRKIHGKIAPYSAATRRLKVSPRSIKFLNLSKDALAGDRITTSPGSAARAAARTAWAKSSYSSMTGLPGA